MTAYYNEIDPYAAQWLRNLITAGLIASGDVDERSILDVRPADLAGYTQCHFFAGVGIWSHALRAAGWGDDTRVWTGSCPCQPFSAAGKGDGFDDERHLWPAFHHLIEQCSPERLFGEQVASKDGLAWLDLVQADMEATGYAFAALDICAAGFGAPHIRQRLYWAAYTARDGRRQISSDFIRSDGGSSSEGRPAGLAVRGGLEPLARADNSERRPDAPGGHQRDGQDAGRPQGPGDAQGRGSAGALAHDHNERHERSGSARGRRDGFADDVSVSALADNAGPRYEQAREHERGPSQLSPRLAEYGGVVRPTGPTNGTWRDADWLLCRDEHWRPVEGGTFPLAHGDPARVGRLRAYGNAIVASQATEFIIAASGAMK